jgi:hypothetical protein
MVKKEESSNFLWHKVSEEEKEKIREGAKKIMEDFGKALEKVDSRGDFVFVERDDFARDEGNVLKPDPEFKKMMFENALKKNRHSILAERGGWV